MSERTWSNCKANGVKGRKHFSTTENVCEYDGYF